MPAAVATAPAATESSGQTEGMTRLQKLAALLVMMGPENAALVLRQFPPREVEAISREMVRFTLITPEQQQALLQELTPVILTAAASVCAGVEAARATLEKALGAFKASDILGRIAPGRPVPAAMQDLTEMDPRHVTNLIRDEHPQTIAFVISHLPPEKAAQVLNLLRPEQRDKVIERLATLAPTPVEVTEKVAEVINAKLGVKQTRALTQTGGVTPAADILNAMDKETSRALLASLEERNPELCQAIRKKMFTFEDLRRLDNQAIQRILREIEMRDLVLALKKASEPLTQLLLSNISRRAAETIREELAFLGHVKLRDIEAAQFRIIDVVRKLEAEGEIDLDVGMETEDAVV